MIKVKNRGNETTEQMLRRFKKACEKEGLTKDIKRVAYYEKPSENAAAEPAAVVSHVRFGSDESMTQLVTVPCM